MLSDKTEKFLEITEQENKEMLEACTLAVEQEGLVPRQIKTVFGLEVNPEFKKSVENCLSASIAQRKKEILAEQDNKLKNMLKSQKIENQNQDKLLDYRVLDQIQDPIEKINFYINTVNTMTMRFANSDKYFGIKPFDLNQDLYELQFKIENPDHPNLIAETYSRFMTENQTLVVGNGGGGLNAVSNSSKEVLVNLYKNMLDLNNLVERVYPNLKTKEEKYNFVSTLENGILQLIYLNVLDRTGLFHNIQIDTDDYWIKLDQKKINDMKEDFRKGIINGEILEYAPELKGFENLHQDFISNISRFSELLGERDYNVFQSDFWNLINEKNLHYIYEKIGKEYKNISKQDFIKMKKEIVDSGKTKNHTLYYKLTDQLKSMDVFLKTNYSALVVEDENSLVGAKSSGSGGDVRVGKKAMEDFIAESLTPFVKKEQFTNDILNKYGIQKDKIKEKQEEDPNILRSLQLPIEKNKNLIELNKYCYVNNRTLMKTIQRVRNGQEGVSQSDLFWILNLPLPYYLYPKYIYNVEKIMTTFAAGGGSGAPIAVELVSYIQKYFKDVKVFSHYHINDEENEFSAEKVTQLWKYALRDIHTKSTGIYIISNKLAQNFIGTQEGQKMVTKNAGKVVYNFMDKDLGKQFYAEQILQYPFTSDKNTSITQLDAKDINNVTKSKGGIKLFSQTTFDFDPILSNIKNSKNSFVNDSVETDFNINLDISNDVYIEADYEERTPQGTQKENLNYLNPIIEEGLKNFNKQYIVPFQIKEFSGNASDYEFSSSLTSNVQNHVKEYIVRYLKQKFGVGGNNTYWRESIRYNSLEKMRNKLNYSSLIIMDSVVSVEEVNDFYYKFAINKLASLRDRETIKNWTNADYDNVEKVKALDFMQDISVLETLKEIQWLDYDHIFVPNLEPLDLNEELSAEEKEERIRKENEIKKLNTSISLKIPGKLKERAFGFYDKNANLGSNLKPQLEELMNPDYDNVIVENNNSKKASFFSKVKGFFKK